MKTISAWAFLITPLLLPFVSAQNTTCAELLPDLITYRSNQCCGESFTYWRVPAGRCVKNVAHPQAFGVSLTMTALWLGDYVAYGYLTGFKDDNCQVKSYEIRHEGCVKLGDANKAKSWMWTKEMYGPSPSPARRDIEATASAYTGSENSKDAERLGMGADYFSYFDESEGREKRISLESHEHAEAVLKMHDEGDFAGLRDLREYTRRR